MDWKHVWTYVAIMFGSTFCVGFVFGIVGEVYMLQGRLVPDWVLLWQGVAHLIAVGLVFILMSRQRPISALEDGLLVAVINWVIALFVNVLFLGDPIQYWLASAPMYCLMLVLGIPVGRWLAARSSKGKDDGNCAGLGA